MKIGCSGHINLKRIEGFTLPLARERIHDYFQRRNPKDCVLYSGFAYGADLLFVDVAQKLGIKTVAVLPCEIEEFAGEHPDGGKQFYALLKGASEVVICKHKEHRYLAVADEILRGADEIAVLWDKKELPLFDEDGKEINRGGTFDVVRRAKEQGIPVQLIF